MSAFSSIVTNEKQSRKEVPTTLEKTVIAINIHVVNAISLTKRVNPTAFYVSTAEIFVKLRRSLDHFKQNFLLDNKIISIPRNIFVCARFGP